MSLPMSLEFPADAAVPVVSLGTRPNGFWLHESKGKVMSNRSVIGYVGAAMLVVGAAVIIVFAHHAMFIVGAESASSGLETSVPPSLIGRQVFPHDDPWNTDISSEPVDPRSDDLIASIGADTGLHPDFGRAYRGVPAGIPYVIVSGDQPRVPVAFQNEEESDPGPYPIPPNAAIEQGGDRHVIVIDQANWVLYELYRAFPEENGTKWRAESGAIFDLARNSVQRPLGRTSADSAGLPIFAGLVRYDEMVEQGKITHALRFTARSTRHAYVYPATHFASPKKDNDLPPMGMRVRLRRNFDIFGFPPAAQVILQALKTYGMILADNGGDWFISGAPDPRWNTDEIKAIEKVNGSAFEVVRMGPMETK